MKYYRITIIITVTIIIFIHIRLKKKIISIENCWKLINTFNSMNFIIYKINIILVSQS